MVIMKAVILIVAVMIMIKIGGDEGWLVKEKKNGNVVLQSKGLCVKA